jgi:hypothetical protein
METIPGWPIKDTFIPLREMQLLQNEILPEEFLVFFSEDPGYEVLTDHMFH